MRSVKACLAISVIHVCRKVVGWMERSSVLAACREEREALNIKRLKNVLDQASFIHAFLDRSKFPWSKGSSNIS